MQVCVHQISVLSLMLFAIAVKAITEYAKEDLMNKILNADDLVLIGKNTENLREKFLKWK